MARILIVEDDRGMALGLSASLTHEGYTVTTCPGATMFSRGTTN